MQTSGAVRRENADTHSVVIVREGGRSSIPEAAVIEPISRGVLDTRLRGYDDPLCGGSIASLVIMGIHLKAVRPFQLKTIRNKSLLLMNGNCASHRRL
jgi:hypothetical protein